MKFSWLTYVYFFACLFSEPTQVNAQRYLSSSGHNKTDTIYIFNDRLKILLKREAYSTITSTVLDKKYSHQFAVGQVKESYGFVIQNKDTLRFYQTSLDRPLAKDGSLSIWKMIDSIVFKIPNGRWLESGWNNLGADYLYFVKLVSSEKVLFDLNFFFLDEKLTFSVFQHTVPDLYFTKSENYKVVHL